MSFPPIKEQLALIKKNTVEIIPEEELVKKLEKLPVAPGATIDNAISEARLRPFTPRFAHRAQRGSAKAQGFPGFST